MKQFNNHRFSPAPVVVAISAAAVLGIAAFARGNGGLNACVNKLRHRLGERDAVIDRRLEAITAENAALHQSMELLSVSLDKMAAQNDKLLTANNALALALEEEHGRAEKLMSVVAEESAEKLSLTRQLEELRGRLSSMTDEKSVPADAPGVKAHIA